jgi:hypothetical protein
MTIPFVLSAASLCIAVFSFFFSRWYIARKTAARELLADYRAEVYRLIAEIDAAADRDSLLVEERIKTLKKLIEDTDRRIGVYMRELQRSRNGEAMYTSLGRGIRAALDSRTPQLELIPQEKTTEDGRPADGTELHGEKKEKTDKEDTDTKNSVSLRGDKDSEPSPAPRRRGAKKPKVKVQIAAMAAQGLPPEKIASRLKLSIAEVELALNLLHRNPHE